MHFWSYTVSPSYRSSTYPICTAMFEIQISWAINYPPMLHTQIKELKRPSLKTYKVVEIIQAPLFCKSLLQLARKFLFNLGSNTRHFLTNILQMQIFPCRIRKYLFRPELGRCWRKKGWEESTWTFKLATQVWKCKFENPNFVREDHADGNDFGNALLCWYDM